MASKFDFEKITSHLQLTGYVFPGSQIYGGLANSWDYGPLGAELKKNVKAAWWKKFVQESPTNVGLDAAILMNPKVWEATGHVSTFNDPMIDCKSCKARHRADDLIKSQYPDADVDNMTFEDMDKFIQEHKMVCPVCGKSDFTPIRKFNMMFKTHIGVTEDASTVVYLRPETAQGVFVNFKNVQRATRKKFRSVFATPARVSATRSLLGISLSGLANSSKWKWNSSASREPIWNGSSIGRISALSSLNP